MWPSGFPRRFCGLAAVVLGPSAGGWGFPRQAMAAADGNGAPLMDEEQLLGDATDAAVSKAPPPLLPATGKRSRAASKARGASEAPGEEEAMGSPCAKTAKMRTAEECAAAVTHHRQCSACGKHDDEPDPISPTHPMRWGYYRVMEQVLHTEGSACYWDLRVDVALYRTRFSLAQYKK